ncbi:MAG: HAD family phosphatase [Tidjanibacter sp.]|nr:HAD family phosphatase [Tidjanibacter sp.]
MIRNVIFDIGGVVLGRDFSRLAELLGDTFSFIAGNDFPAYWSEFDRGTYTREEVASMLASDKGCSIEEAQERIQALLDLLQPVSETVELIAELKGEGVKTYVLSNMSREFYEHISTTFDVFEHFDGAVVSCYERINKPDEGIYTCLLERYGLEPSETLFVDDKAINTAAAAELGLHTVTFDEQGVENIRALLARHNQA